MANLMNCGVNIVVDVPTKIHRSIAHALIQHVTAKIRPGAIIPFEANTNLSFIRGVDFNEFQTNANILPGLEGIADNISL